MTEKSKEKLKDIKWGELFKPKVKKKKKKKATKDLSRYHPSVRDLVKEDQK